MIVFVAGINVQATWIYLKAPLDLLILIPESEQVAPTKS